METLVKMEGVTKVFPGVRALDNISFEIKAGEVHVLMGENGAGKSTLMKILSGVYQPTSGKITVKGKEFTHLTPKDSYECGISIIYQELSVINELSILENLFVGKLPTRRVGGIRVVDYKGMTDRAREVLDKVGLKRRPGQLVEEISISEKQQCEIAKALISNADVIIMDEPTSSLTTSETAHLFDIIRQLRAEGKIIFYVSHRMNEIAQVAQKVIIFKDGRLVEIVDQATTPEDQMIRLMVGRSLGDIYDALPRSEHPGEAILEVKELCTPYVSDISFTAHRGEILGFAGLVGAGRTEVMRALFGLDPVYSGSIGLEGRAIQPKSPAQALALGFAMVPEDRKMQGILPNISVRGNITVSMLKKLVSPIGFVMTDKEEQIAQREIAELNIKTPNSDKLIAQLSGGNQQKVILARWLETHPKVLILDEPTKGIDVGAKAEFYRIIAACAQQGMAVIVISSELPEVIGLSDRIIVMREGRISGEVSRADFSEEIILKYAMASVPQNAEQ